MGGATETFIYNKEMDKVNKIIRKNMQNYE